MISVAQKASFHKILAILSEHGLLDHLILIGSWAEFIYEASGILGTFEANLRTRDYDFFVPNAARPSPPVGMKGKEEENPEIVKRDDNSWLMDGLLSIEEFK